MELKSKAWSFLMYKKNKYKTKGKRMKKLSIRKLAKNPANSLQKMIDGLYTQEKRDDFRIYLYSFGDFYEDSGICYGCAATCTIQELANKNLTRFTIAHKGLRAEALNFDREDLYKFEKAIDNARCGKLNSLFDFFEIKRIVDEPKNITNFKLKNNNWKTEIPKVKKYIKFLKSKAWS